MDMALQCTRLGHCGIRCPLLRRERRSRSRLSICHLASTEGDPCMAHSLCSQLGTVSPRYRYSPRSLPLTNIEPASSRLLSPGGSVVQEASWPVAPSRQCRVRQLRIHSRREADNRDDEIEGSPPVLA